MNIYLLSQTVCHAKFGQPSKGLGRQSASDPEDIEVYVEYNFADYFPKEKPHYE